MTAGSPDDRPPPSSRAPSAAPVLTAIVARMVAAVRSAEAGPGALTGGN